MVIPTFSYFGVVSCVLLFTAVQMLMTDIVCANDEDLRLQIRDLVRPRSRGVNTGLAIDNAAIAADSKE